MICDFVILNHLGCDFDFKSFQEKIFGDFDFKITFSCTILILNQIKNDFQSRYASVRKKLDVEKCHGPAKRGGGMAQWPPP
jgi:hypothetical protein